MHLARDEQTKAKNNSSLCTPIIWRPDIDQKFLDDTPVLFALLGLGDMHSVSSEVLCRCRFCWGSSRQLRRLCCWCSLLLEMST